MRVSELMHTPVTTCTTSTTLRDVAKLMEARNVGSVVVVDKIGYLAGIVTDRDIALRAIGEGRSADVVVEEIMTRDVATVPPWVEASDAAAVMQKRRVRRVPVVSDSGAPDGVVSFDDLVRALGRDTDVLTDTLLAQASGL